MKNACEIFNSRQKEREEFRITKLLHDKTKEIATYSIVAYDPINEEWGVAVQSKFFAVGSIVPWAQASSGAIATQSIGNPIHGIVGLQKLRDGCTAGKVLEELLKEDELRDLRQIGIVDSYGNTATFTGNQCASFADGITGENYAVQGNYLHNKQVIKKMGKAFEQEKGTLSERLLRALATAEVHGGDRRGRQSSSILVVKNNSGYGGTTDRYMDIRVDDHPLPIDELKRLHSLHQLYWKDAIHGDIIEINQQVKKEIINCLNNLDYFNGKIVNEKNYENKLEMFLINENIIHRKQEKGKIDLKVYKYLQKKSFDKKNFLKS